jgi:ribulose kinase
MIDDVQWFVGIDWATQSHRACLLDVEGRHVSERDFAHDGDGVARLAA